MEIQSAVVDLRRLRPRKSTAQQTREPAWKYSLFAPLHAEVLGLGIGAVVLTPLRDDDVVGRGGGRAHVVHILGGWAMDHSR